MCLKEPETKKTWICPTVDPVVHALETLSGQRPALTAAIENNAGTVTVLRWTAEIATQLEVHLDQEEDSLKILEASLAGQSMQDIAHCALLILF